MTRRTSHPAPLAFAAILGASGVTAAALWRAIVIDVVEPRGLGATWQLQQILRQHPVPPAVIANTVEKDPFRPDRRPPALRFRLPGARAPTTNAAAGAALPSSLRLTGTMMYHDGGGAALFEGVDRSTRIVRVGETVGGLRLSRVTKGEAVFVSPGGAAVTVRVTRTGG